jgi:hypothetical protein
MRIAFMAPEFNTEGIQRTDESVVFS